VSAEPRRTEAVEPLAGVRVLVLTSGHEALDSRIYGREARSLRALGARVTVVGKLTRGTTQDSDVLPVPAPSSRLERFLLQPWRCLWRAKGCTPDIVHFHDAEMLAVLPVARLWWPGAKFVYDVHEDFAELMMIRDWLPEGLKPAARALTNGCEKTLSRLAHGVVAVTPPLAAPFPQACKVSAMNFPTSDFYEAAAAVRSGGARRFDIVHLGTLNRRRAAFLSDVLTRMQRTRPQLRSLVVGASADILEFLGGRVPAGCELRGLVPHDEVPGLLAGAKVGIDVHPWLGRHLEPALAVKVCEYMGAGCAVVASPMPVLEEVLSRSKDCPEGIEIVAGEDPEAFARAALRLIGAIEGGGDPGESLRRFALEHMQWDREAGNIAALYRALLNGETCGL
jgi:glycosyltransferase involved in cell wall biosynthesis